jgi:hypothetical protein
MAPQFVETYERYHARIGYFVEAQRVPVDRATADRLIANAEDEGQAFKTQCAITLAHVLRPVPPFQEVRRSLFPQALREEFARLDGVETSTVHDTDIGKNNEWERGGAVAALQPAVR